MVIWTVAPTEAGYAITDNPGSYSVQLDGGAGRFRAGQAGATSKVHVKWLAGKSDYAILMSLYGQTNGGAEPLAIDLVLDDHVKTNKIAYIVPGSFRMAQIDGLTYSVEMDLEVIP
jgi:hypothetical protein